MKIQYFPETDTLSVWFASGPSADTEEIGPGAVVDFDAEGRVIAIEFEDASKLDVSEVETVGVPVAKVVAAASRSGS